MTGKGPVPLKTPEFWMSLKLRWDLYHVLRTEKKIINRIKPLSPVA